jgi:hypothetical protein
MLEREWDYYETHRGEIVKEYCGKYAVITENGVIAAYDDEKSAYHETIKTIPVGSFMLHHIAKEEEIACLSPIESYA